MDKFDSFKWNSRAIDDRSFLLHTFVNSAHNFTFSRISDIC